MSNNNNKVILASIWMLAAKWIEKSLGIISIIILARILSPNDYGLAALAQIVVVTFQIILFDGTETYLVRKENINSEDYNTAWTIRAFLFMIIGWIIYLLRFYISDFLNEEKLIDVLVVSSLTTMISGFASIGIIKARKELNYKPIFLINIFKKIIAFSITVSLAISLKNYWALVWGLSSMQIANVILSYIFLSYRPKLTLIKLTNQFNFTKWIMIGNITSFIRNKYTELILPKYMGISVLGQYNMAYQLANMANDYIITPINSPILASYSTVKNNHKELHLQIIKAIGILSVLIMPLYFGQFMLSYDIILLVLGYKWLNIVYIFDVFIGIIVIQSYIGSINTILTVIGKVKLISLLNWLILFLLLPIITYAIIYENLETIVTYRLKISIISLLIYSYALNKNIKINWKLLIQSVFRPFIAASLMLIFLYLSKDLFNNEIYELTILFKIIAASITYSVTLIFLWCITGKNIGGEHYLLGKLYIICSKKKYLSKIGKYLNPLIT